MKQEGFSYSFDPSACRECAGSCCRGRSGHIWVNTKELERIAEFLQANRVDIIAMYLVRVDNRFSIRERYVDGEYLCVFFDPDRRQCSIYPTRPEQCRSFPFWPYFRGREEELLAECPGVRLLG